MNNYVRKYVKLTSAKDFLTPPSAGVAAGTDSCTATGTATEAASNDPKDNGCSTSTETVATGVADTDTLTGGDCLVGGAATSSFLTGAVELDDAEGSGVAAVGT